MANQSVFVAIAAVIVDPIVQFYQAMFACPPQRFSPGQYAEFQLEGLRLAIFRPTARHQAEFSAPTSGSFSLCVEVPDLEVAIARCTALGYPPPGAVINAAHGREIYAYDPLGNRLILHESALDPGRSQGEGDESDPV